MDLHIIFGPTASSKSKLAFSLWQQYGYPILSVDSRKVYKFADIGTNKYTMVNFIKSNPSMTVAGIDFLEPTEEISAYIYQQYVYDWLNKNEALLRERGGLIIHGGTGLYLDSILEGHGLLAEKDEFLRSELNALSLAELQEKARQNAKEKYALLNESDRSNPRRLIRLIENAIQKILPEKAEVPLVLQEMKKIWHLPTIEREQAYQIINERVWTYVDLGWLDEVANLLKKYGENIPALQMMGYRQLVKFMKENSNWQELARTKAQVFIDVIALIQQEHRRYAKRQVTWGKKYQAKLDINC